MYSEYNDLTLLLKSLLAGELFLKIHISYLFLEKKFFREKKLKNSAMRMIKGLTQL